MFKRVLIANRGEIAVRIARTLRRLGIESVAVHSSAEPDALHVRVADRAFEIGPPSPRHSYLVVERIIDVARRAGADAIHPGYGFLSENAEFAIAVRSAGLAFVGPSDHAIRTMGDKSGARAAATACGVPVVPGQDIDPTEPAAALAESIGLPLMLKAVAGGGGRGMRRIESLSELEQGMRSAAREAEAAFGIGLLYAEKVIQPARHIEVQVVGDHFGQVAILGERDCSVQRHHQKVIEESPSTAITLDVRRQLGDAALTLARHVAYENAGTVEFLLDRTTNEFFFLEMNTRLQVEHGVTELVTGLDLVELQLRVAAGERLDASLVAGVTPTGHAIEFRLYAEDPQRGYMPSPGRITALQLPAHPIRVDSGVEQGDEITPFYDPMIAKVLVHAPARAEALAAARHALSQTRVEGIHTNLAQLQAIANHSDFADGTVHTTWLEEVTLSHTASRDDRRWLISALAVSLHKGIGTPGNSWHAAGTAGTGPQLERYLRLPGGELAEIRTTVLGERTLMVATQDDEWRFAYNVSGHVVAVSLEGERRRFSVDRSEDGICLRAGADTWHANLVHRPAPQVPREKGQQPASDLVAALSGEVVRLEAREGQEVAVGQPLVILQAMKMEHVLVAQRGGLVQKVQCKVGDQVSRGDVLIRFGDDGDPDT